MVEKVVEELGFDYADRHQEEIEREGKVLVTVDAAFVHDRLKDSHKKVDLQKYLI